MAVTLLMAALGGCADERPVPEAPGGVHPVGWGDRSSPAFHAEWLKTNGFPLPRCQQCHGADYAGGAVGVSCAQANCHAAAPTACTTCHGTDAGPRPQTGAHFAHQAFCDTCHKVPTTAEVQQHASGDESTILRFGGLAVQGGLTPSFDRDTKRCSNTYCHGGLSPAWTDPAQIQCNGCHDAPPANHARWSRLTASGEGSCTTCHPAPTEPTHVNGQVNVTVSSCTTCHGSNGHPNPPVALDGTTDPSSRGVGAHVRHLDGALPDRISKPLACNTCHVVPAAVTDPGHVDQPETQVRFVFGGSYDKTNATCNVWCHFNRTPGPVWTDSSGGARQCNSCHEFPPKVTRAGTPHPTVAGDLTVCQYCHVFDPSTHVNGVVDFAPLPP